jgi:hypothetical protein
MEFSCLAENEFAGWISCEGENEFTRDQRRGQSQNFGATLESRKVDCCQRAEAKNISKCAVPKRHKQASPKIFHKLTTGNTKMSLISGVSPRRL